MAQAQPLRSGGLVPLSTTATRTSRPVEPSQAHSRLMPPIAPDAINSRSMLATNCDDQAGCNSAPVTCSISSRIWLCSLRFPEIWLLLDAWILVSLVNGHLLY